jgi:sirohydrochlorin ferrochelatase
VTTHPRPVLLAASHGTRDPVGQSAVASLVQAVSQSLPDVRVEGSFIDVQRPDVPASLDGLNADLPVIVVPLLLSTGYHVRVDLADAARLSSHEVRVTTALGPDARLVGILARRLEQAGLRANDAVVLAAAGSSDTSAVADCHVAGRQLAQILGREVTVGFISAAEPRLSHAVETAHKANPRRRVVVASYLLAPGYFAGLAETAGADVVSAPLLAAGEEPPATLVETVVELYASAVRNVTDVLRTPINTSSMP